ncbi:MAG: 50S ribosomal protein L11 methyltransferase [Hyphomicrobium sp.]|nr:50S ribosomal protein L11 methyltransferase [Hyphomicrobium sp.]
MSLRKVTAYFTDRQLAYRVGNALQDFVEPPPEALTVFENGPGAWRVEAYFDAIDSTAPERDFATELAGVIAQPLPAFVSDEVPDLNWVALSQAALPPVEAGRFTIHGSHDRGRVARGPTSILIDAGEAFGTAHHATTHGCLLAIDRLTRVCTFDTVLDLGCGSGVLAIAVAKALPHADIIATDLDPQSVKVATENVRLNGVASRIALTTASGVDHTWLRQSPPFDLVIANILAGPLIRLAPAMARTVVRGGTLLLSGILIPQAPQVLAAYRTAGFHLVQHDRITGWSTLTLRRR